MQARPSWLGADHYPFEPSHVPTLIMCGMKDLTFGEEKLRRWQAAFPDHTLVRFDDIGHFVPEELGPAAVSPIRTFLEDTTARGAQRVAINGGQP